MGPAQGGFPLPLVERRRGSRTEEGLEGPPWAGIGLDRRGHCGSAGPHPWSMPRSCPHSSPSFHGGCCLSSALRCCLACFFPSLSLALSPTPICSLTLDYWFRLRGPKNVDSIPLCLTNGPDFVVPPFKGLDFPNWGIDGVSGKTCWLSRPP